VPVGHQNPALSRTEGQQKGAHPQLPIEDEQEKGGSLRPEKCTDSLLEQQLEGREKQTSAEEAPQSNQDIQSSGGAICNPSERANDPPRKEQEEKAIAMAEVEQPEGAAEARKRFRLLDGKVSVDGRASEGVADGTDGRAEGASGVNGLASEREVGGEDGRAEGALGVNGLTSEGVAEEEDATLGGASGLNGLASIWEAEGGYPRAESASGVNGISFEKRAEEREEDGKLEDAFDAKELPSEGLAEEIEEDRQCGDDVSSREAAALGGAAAGAGSLGDVIENVTETSGRDEAEWEEWADDGARPFVVSTISRVGFSRFSSSRYCSDRDTFLCITWKDFVRVGVNFVWSISRKIVVRS
jgi:hypothetical protein